MVEQGRVLDLKKVSCKLCGGNGSLIYEDKSRPFYLCSDCELIFVPEIYYLTIDEERVRYDLHDNTISNSGYVKYLSQVVDVVSGSFNRDAKILDYGCGKNAVLCALLNDAGFNCDPYDPLYSYVLDDACKYDIVILCEVIEHLRDITKTFAHIKNLLRDGGAVIIRTQPYDDLQTFPKWWYAQDPTHINFFNKKSLKQLAQDLCKKNVSETKYYDVFVLG